MFAAWGERPTLTLLLDVFVDLDCWKVRLRGGSGKLAAHICRALYAQGGAAARREGGGHVLWKGGSHDDPRRNCDRVRSEVQLICSQLGRRGYELVGRSPPREDGEVEATHVFFARLALLPEGLAEVPTPSSVAPGAAALRLRPMAIAAAKQPVVAVVEACMPADLEAALRKSAPWLWALQGSAEQIALTTAGVHAVCGAILATGYKLAAVIGDPSGDLHVFSNTAGPATGSARLPPAAPSRAAATTPVREGLGHVEGACSKDRFGPPLRAVLRLRGGREAEAAPAAQREPPEGRLSAARAAAAIAGLPGPAVTVSDAAEFGEGGPAKLVRVSLAGLVEETLEIEGLPNGVGVVAQRSSGGPAFERAFEFDHRSEGRLELSEPECQLGGGTLLLVLRPGPAPQRWRLPGRPEAVVAPPRPVGGGVVASGVQGPPELFSLAAASDSDADSADGEWLTVAEPKSEDFVCVP